METDEKMDSPVIYAAVSGDSYVIYAWNEKGLVDEIDRIKIGQIFIERYNQKIDQFLKAGIRLENGRRDGNFLIFRINDDPIMDVEIPTLEYYTEENFSEHGFEGVKYIKTAFINLNGKLTQVFRIEKTEDLFFFDAYQMYVLGMKVKNCKNCGRVFIVKKNQVRCEECRKAGYGEKDKYKSLMESPLRKRKRQVQQNLRLWHPGENNYQRIYGNALIARVNACTNIADIDALINIHHAFNDLDKAMHKPTISSAENHTKSWDEQKFTIWEKADPGKWIRSWYE